MPTAIAHDLAQASAAARAAATVGRALTVQSAPGVGRSLGVAGWLALVEAARTAAPTADLTFTLDCGDWPSDAYAAIVGGAERIAIAPSPAYARLKALAEQEAVAIDDRPADIDLAFHHDPEAACRRLLETANS